jgi:hypothetical protein
MKIHGSQPQHPHHAMAMRHAAKAAAETATPTATVAPAATEPTTAPTTTTPTDAAAPVVATESTVALAARKLPPGLVKVAARLEAMGAEGRNGGQSNALAQVTRNLQRYADVHGLALPTAPAPQAPTAPAPEADASVPEVDASVPATPTDPVTAPPAPPATVAEAMLIDALLDDAVETTEPTEPAPL